MKNKLLLSNKYKKVGWFLLLPSALAGILLQFTDFEVLSLNTKVFAIISDPIFGESRAFSFISTNITSTIVGILFITGALLVGFSKEKEEDEYISNLRQSSLLWAVLVNYILLIFSFMFIYGTSFLTVMLYNMFTVLILFIARFNYVLHRNSKFTGNEKHN